MRDFSQIKTLLPELFCKCSTALKNCFFNIGRVNRELELGKADCMLLKIKRFSSWKLKNTAAKGSIAWENRGNKTVVWTKCTWRQLPVSSYDFLKLVINYIYVYGFTLNTCTLSIALFLFSHIVYVYHSITIETVQIYLCFSYWLMLNAVLLIKTVS